MASARRRSFVTRASRTRNMAWGGIQVPPTTLAADTKVILGSFVLSTQFDETVLRTRGGFMVHALLTTPPNLAIAAVGMIVVSEDAFAAGIGSVPGPITDIGNDEWFFWQPLANTFDAAGGLGGGTWYEFDQKGKRIVREGNRIVLVAEGVITPGTETLTVAGFVRILGMFRS